MNNIKISAIITSGGNSTRFGSNKLVEKLGEYSVIETTILKFINFVDEIIIPATPDTKEFILNSKVYDNKIKFASSGDTRQKSVYNGLMECNNPDMVLIHDGARPFISIETIKEAIELTKTNDAVTVGKMATDTIKVVKQGRIITTLNRNELFHAQTPQCFKYDLIKSIHEKYKNISDFTDDSSMAEAEKIQPVILISKGNNNKITFREDLSHFRVECS